MTTKTKAPQSRRAPKSHVAYTMRGDGLASEGILDGYTLIVDKKAVAHTGDLGMIRTLEGGVVAKRITSEDLPLVIGRVIQSYVIPQDSKYLILNTQGSQEILGPTDSGEGAAMAPLPFPIKLGIARRGKYVVLRMHRPDEALYLCLEAGVAIRTPPPGGHDRTRPHFLWVSRGLIRDESSAHQEEGA